MCDSEMDPEGYNPKANARALRPGERRVRPGGGTSPGVSTSGASEAGETGGRKPSEPGALAEARDGQAGRDEGSGPGATLEEPGPAKEAQGRKNEPPA